MPFRFENCVLDPVRRSLTCAGQPVTLNPKTFDLLVYLVTHAGRVVSKDELLSALWPDSFVEERNLTQHIFLLRRALATNALGEGLVVTIPGRGYQFVERVESEPVDPPGRLTPQPGDVIVHAVQTTTTVVVEEGSEGISPAQALRRLLPASPRESKTFWVGMACAVLLVLCAGASRWMLLPRPVLRKVVLADFKNQTGEPVFDDSLQSGLRIDLEQSPYIELLGRAQITEALATMQKSADTPLTNDVAREVCERSNDQVLLTGGIARIASQYQLTLEATSCASGDPVAEEKQTVADENQIFSALDSLTRKMRRELGESRRQVAEFQVPIAQATTSSLPALRAYSQALASSDRGDTAAERALLQRALALDPNFASAYEELGISYNNRLDFVQGTANMQKAYDLRAQTTERERLAIEIAYNVFAKNDWETAIVAMRLYSQVYPDDADNWYTLARTYSGLGMYPQAVAAGEDGYRLAPHSGYGADILARVYRRAGRFVDAKRIAAAAIAEGKDRWGMHRTLFSIAFAENDAAAMQAQSAWGLMHQEVGQTLIEMGFAAASDGRLREARDDFQRARQEGLKSGDPDFADDASMFLAGILIEYGDPAGAAQNLQQIRYNEEDEPTTAYFWCELGKLDPAKKFLAKIDDGEHSSSLNRYFDGPELRGCLDLEAHDPSKAVEDLAPARKYQLRDYGVPSQFARAEAQAGMIDQAAADYRLILANPGIEPTWPAYTLSHLYLARVLAKQQKTAEARAEYQAFLGAWKDADRSLPLFQQARNEFAALP